jgi:hypothetical protein
MTLYDIMEAWCEAHIFIIVALVQREYLHITDTQKAYWMDDM